MTQPRPTAAELVEAVGEFLADEPGPERTGRSRFHARVAANVLDLVARELRHGPDADADEARVLASFLDRDGDASELSESLALRLRDGSLDVDDRRLRAALVELTALDLGIANPGWAEE